MVVTGKTPVIAKSFEAGIRDTFSGGPDVTTNSIIQKESKRGETIVDVSFTDGGLLSKVEESLFYEPKISKPIRGKRDLTIKLNKKGKLEGIPTAWREVLELPPQEQEVEEIDEGL